MAITDFLPGVPAEHILNRLATAGGKEVESGKFASPESSAALAVNCFGWFIERLESFPPLPGMDDCDPVEMVDVEFTARFPWSGGRHPWLDAVVQTQGNLIGIESKRFEPFRDQKSVSLSSAYDRPVWGDNMQRYEQMRDRLRSGSVRFRHLNAVQLVKHAFGLVTEARRRGRSPVLFYIFAEPTSRAGKAIPHEDILRHREEITEFARAVDGDEVAFQFSSYRDWISTWPDACDLQAHGRAIIERFSP
ncbi:PGN_0703 family putative restriction endonuclease [Erythrobacter aureus]|uniref:PGN_0703 family putative restriction endonuclease n=1 Tax=Erythrobacter aureus TaxID=2182384 RepID=UPI003A8D73B5